MPKLAVDQELIDYGNLKLDASLAFAIEVTNMGDGTPRKPPTHTVLTLLYRADTPEELYESMT